MNLKLLWSAAVLGISLLGCVQTENSSSQDKASYSNLQGSSGFTQARTILQQKCAACHNYHTLTEAQMVATGILVRGDLASSKVYYRLAGASVGPGPRDMPTGGSLTGSEISQIETWIQNTGQ